MQHSLLEKLKQEPEAGGTTNGRPQTNVGMRSAYRKAQTEARQDVVSAAGTQEWFSMRQNQIKEKVSSKFFLQKTAKSKGKQNESGWKCSQSSMSHKAVHILSL